MNILVVSKKTNLELHGETIRRRVKSGLIDAEHLKLLEQTHEEHYKTLDQISALLKEFQIKSSSIARGSYWPELQGYDAVLTVGGDGTVFEASQHILNENILLVGVRSTQTSVGKLCHVEAGGLKKFFKDLAAKKVRHLKVARMQAKVMFAETGFISMTKPILNDCLYTNISPAATTRYKITFENKTEEQRSSGLWVSTPCGSTAAIHAAGAKPISLKEDFFQFLVRELYDSGKTSGAEALRWGCFKGQSSELQIENLSEKAMLSCDGAHNSIALSYGDKIDFLRGPDLNLACPDYFL